MRRAAASVSAYDKAKQVPVPLQFCPSCSGMPPQIFRKDFHRRAVLAERLPCRYFSGKDEDNFYEFLRTVFQNAAGETLLSGFSARRHQHAGFCPVSNAGRRFCRPVFGRHRICFAQPCHAVCDHQFCSCRSHRRRLRRSNLHLSGQGGEGRSQQPVHLRLPDDCGGRRGGWQCALWCGACPHPPDGCGRGFCRSVGTVSARVCAQFPCHYHHFRCRSSCASAATSAAACSSISSCPC